MKTKSQGSLSPCGRRCRGLVAVAAATASAVPGARARPLPAARGRPDSTKRKGNGGVVELKKMHTSGVRLVREVGELSGVRVEPVLEYVAGTVSPPASMEQLAGKTWGHSLTPTRHSLPVGGTSDDLLLVAPGCGPAGRKRKGGILRCVTTPRLRTASPTHTQHSTGGHLTSVVKMTK